MTEPPATPQAPTASPVPAQQGVTPPAHPKASSPAKDHQTELGADDSDLGWGESAVIGDERDEWFRRERPPHHGD